MIRFYVHTPLKSVLNLLRSTEIYRPVNVPRVFRPEILKRIHSKTGNGFLLRMPCQVVSIRWLIFHSESKIVFRFFNRPNPGVITVLFLIYYNQRSGTSYRSAHRRVLPRSRATCGCAFGLINT